jgi:hypothetical protein
MPQPFFPHLDPSWRHPDAAPPLPAPSGFVGAVGLHGRVVAVWTDVEQAAGLAPNLSEPVTLHERPLTGAPQIGQPLTD